jgi:hypothetical protein
VMSFVLDSSTVLAFVQGACWVGQALVGTR